MAASTPPSEETLFPPSGATPVPESAPLSAAAATAAAAQAPERTGATPVSSSFPSVTFGILTFLQYQAQLHESNGYNAFDVTRGYLNIQARLSDRIRVRFTPDVRPTTDASLNQNLALRLDTHRSMCRPLTASRSCSACTKCPGSRSRKRSIAIACSVRSSRNGSD